MKIEWETKRLTEVATVTTGKWDANHSVENGKYRFYTCAYEHSYSNTKRYSGECLILPGNGANVGEVFYYNGDFDAYQRTYVISDIKIFPKYLYYHLNLLWKTRNTSKQYGSATNFIKIGNFHDYVVTFPPLSEQKQIVAKIDDIFKDVEKDKEIAEKNLQNTNDLFDSYLDNIFSNPGEGWVQSELGDMVEITSSKRIYKSEYVKTGVPFYRTKEIVQLENSEKISTELFISNERFLEINDGFGVPKQGDIMLTAIGTIGNVYVVQPTDKFYFKDGNILWLKSSDKISPNLLKYILKSYVETLKTLNIGTAYNALTIEKLKKHKVTVPPSSLQENIISKLDSLKENSKRLERIYKDKLSEIDLLKKSVLNKAFSGEL